MSDSQERFMGGLVIDNPEYKPPRPPRDSLSGDRLAIYKKIQALASDEATAKKLLKVLELFERLAELEGLRLIHQPGLRGEKLEAEHNRVSAMWLGAAGIRQTFRQLNDVIEAETNQGE